MSFIFNTQDSDNDLLRIWQKKTIEESMKKNELLSCHVIRENTSLVGLPEPNVLRLVVDEVLVSNDQGFFSDAIKCQNWHHIESSQLVCRGNQLAGFYAMIMRCLMNCLVFPTNIYEI